MTPDGSAPKANNQFFDSRSRKFAIFIEGKFKRRDGVAPYNGDEVEFGSDFDYLPDSFPRAPLDAGLKVAKWIDPAMHYEMGEKPYIMSPYSAAGERFEPVDERSDLLTFALCHARQSIRCVLTLLRVVSLELSCSPCMMEIIRIRTEKSKKFRSSRLVR